MRKRDFLISTTLGSAYLAFVSNPIAYAIVNKSKNRVRGQRKDLETATLNGHQFLINDDTKMTNRGPLSQRPISKITYIENKEGLHALVMVPYSGKEQSAYATFLYDSDLNTGRDREINFTFESSIAKSKTDEVKALDDYFFSYLTFAITSDRSLDFGADSMAPCRENERTKNIYRVNSEERGPTRCTLKINVEHLEKPNATLWYQADDGRRVLRSTEAKHKIILPKDQPWYLRWTISTATKDEKSPRDIGLLFGDFDVKY